MPKPRHMTAAEVAASNLKEAKQLPDAVEYLRQRLEAGYVSKKKVTAPDNTYIDNANNFSNKITEINQQIAQLKKQLLDEQNKLFGQLKPLFNNAAAEYLTTDEISQWVSDKHNLTELMSSINTTFKGVYHPLATAHKLAQSFEKSAKENLANAVTITNPIKGAREITIHANHPIHALTKKINDAFEQKKLLLFKAQLEVDNYLEGMQFSLEDYAKHELGQLKKKTQGDTQANISGDLVAAIRDRNAEANNLSKGVSINSDNPAIVSAFNTMVKQIQDGLLQQNKNLELEQQVCLALVTQGEKILSEAHKEIEDTLEKTATEEKNTLSKLKNEEEKSAKVETMLNNHIANLELLSNASQNLEALISLSKNNIENVEKEIEHQKLAIQSAKQNISHVKQDCLAVDKLITIIMAENKNLQNKAGGFLSRDRSVDTKSREITLAINRALKNLHAILDTNQRKTPEEIATAFLSYSPDPKTKSVQESLDIKRYSTSTPHMYNRVLEKFTEAMQSQQHRKGSSASH